MKLGNMEGYRLLEVGEAVKEGDQVRLGTYWNNIICNIGEIVQEDIEEHMGRMPYGYYRRLIKSESDGDIMEENGIKYKIIRKGKEQLGDRYMGDKKKNKCFGPDSWVDVRESDVGFDIEKLETMIFRRPIKYKDDVLPPEDISSYPIEDLMKWRNTASKRVDKIDEDLIYLENVLDEVIVKTKKILKKRQKDVKWIVKINNILIKKVIKERN